ncbi:MAG: hypothetical protein QM658_11215 [Gordonia sp. (in: high G+C Gram-positive bacteria)]
MAGVAAGLLGGVQFGGGALPAPGITAIGVRHLPGLAVADACLGLGAVVMTLGPRLTRAPSPAQAFEPIEEAA